MKHLLPFLMLLFVGCAKEQPALDRSSTQIPYQVTHSDLNYRGLEYYRIIVNDTTVTQITHGAYWEELPTIPTVQSGDLIQVEFSYFQGDQFGDHTMTTTITAGNQSQSWGESSWGEYVFIVE